MSIEKLDVVDVMSTDKKTGSVVLTISDHVDWSDSLLHQAMLQAKLNKYLAFVESGEILARYPDAKNRLVVFRIVFKFEPDHEGKAFLDRARQVVESAGFSLQQEVFSS